MNNLLYRDAIRNALGVCDCTIDAIGRKCDVSRQTITLMLRGGVKMRKGTASAIGAAMIDELRKEIGNSCDRIAMIERLIVDVKNTYDREYGREGQKSELFDL